MSHILVGLCGYKGSGKTSLTNLSFLDLADCGVRNLFHLGFVDPAYRMLEALGVPHHIMQDKTKWDDTFPDNPELAVLCGKSLRWACQTLATEWGRNCIDEGIWAISTAERIKSIRRTHDRSFIVVDNMRTELELHTIKSLGGTCVSVVDGRPESGDEHVTETAVAGLQAKCDFTFRNDHEIGLPTCVERFSRLFTNIINSSEANNG